MPSYRSPIASYLITLGSACISVFINVVIIVLNYTHLLPLAEGDLVTMTTTKKLVKDNEDIAASATGEVRK